MTRDELITALTYCMRFDCSDIEKKKPVQCPLYNDPDCMETLCQAALDEIKRLDINQVCKGLECCKITNCEECPYAVPERTCHSPKALLSQTLALITEPPARVLALDEVLGSKGAGWLENWFEADESEPESFELSEVAWCYGTLAHIDGDVSTEDYVKRWYNRRYGMRIWSAKPTDEEREREKWDE
jgi:hypothetical protein